MAAATALDAEATTLRARALVRAGVLSTARLDEARDLIDGPEDVPATVRQLLLLVGVTLLASAVVFFVAANWGAIAALTRMALVALGILACAGVALHVGLKTRGGQAGVTLSGLLIGPLLMLYGQTYQTGADAWELFFGWTLLLLPFIFAARVPALALVALVLLHVTLPLFMTQQLGFDADDDGLFAAGMILMVVDALAAAGVELAHRRRRISNRAGPRTTALLGALVALGAGSAALVVHSSNGRLRLFTVLFACAYAVFLVSSGGLRKRSDMFFLAVGAFLFAALILVFTGHFLFEKDEMWFTAALFVEGTLVLTVIGGLTRLLLRLHRAGAHDAEEEP